MAKDKVILGLLAGAVVGAVAGILLAPGKGSETRKNLSKRGRDTVDNLKGKASELIDTVADKYLSGSEGDNAKSTDSHLAPGAPSPDF